MKTHSYCLSSEAWIPKSSEITGGRQWGIKPESETTVATVEEGATPQPFYGGDVEPLIDLEQQPIQRLDVLNRLGMPTFLPARDETSIGALRRFYD